MRPGEIYLAAFPFGDVPRMKLRPVLLLIERPVSDSRGAGRIHFVGDTGAAFAVGSHSESGSAGVSQLQSEGRVGTAPA